MVAAAKVHASLTQNLFVTEGFGNIASGEQNHGKLRSMINVGELLDEGLKFRRAYQLFEGWLLEQRLFIAVRSWGKVPGEKTHGKPTNGRLLQD